MNAFFKYFSLILFSFFIFSCGGDDGSDVIPASEENGIEFYATIESRTDLNIYQQLLERIEAKKQDNLETLNFAPTDKAFKDYFDQKGINSLADLSDREVYELDRMLRLRPYDPISFSTYPLDSLPDDYYSVYYSDDIYYNNGLNGDFSIYFEKIDDSNVRINRSIDCEVIIIESYEVSLGSTSYITRGSESALLIINEIFKPQTHFDIISQDPEYEEFEKLIIHAGMEDFYQSSEIKTLIIPNDDAFASFYSDQGISGATDIDVEIAKDYLNLHTLQGNSTLRNYPQGTSFIDTYAKNINDNTIQIIINNLANLNYKVYEAFNSNHQADVLKFDVITLSGNFNTINKVLLLP